MALLFPTLFPAPRLPFLSPPSTVPVPWTVRRAQLRTVSAVKATVPVSSSVSLCSVRLCTQPVALIWQVELGFTRMPSRVQTPNTLGWDSWSSNVTVSFSNVSTSDSGFFTVTFRAGEEKKVCDRSSFVMKKAYFKSKQVTRNGIYNIKTPIQQIQNHRILLMWLPLVRKFLWPTWVDSTLTSSSYIYC